MAYGAGIQQLFGKVKNLHNSRKHVQLAISVARLCFLMPAIIV